MTLTKDEAKRIKTLIQKQKGFITDKKTIKQFKEPIMFFMRQTGHVEFYENVRKTRFEYEHSNGENRYILLHPQKLLTFDYGNNTFKEYICYEEKGTPYPDNPTLEASHLNITLEKTLHDMQKWRAEVLKAKGKIVWYALGGIAVIILAYAMYVLLNPTPPPTPVVQVLNEGAKTVARNVTILG